MVIQPGFVAAIVAFYSMHHPALYNGVWSHCSSHNSLNTLTSLCISAIFLGVFVNHRDILNDMAPHSRKRSQGRKKIEMKLIADENARIVTFSKRRAGLFKKATELSILCGAQIALIIFSLGGRAYSFGHPNVESVVDRFLNRNPIPNVQDSAQSMRIHAAMLQQLKEECDKKNEELETKRRRGKEIEEALENSPCQISEERLGLLDLTQLKHLKQMMEQLRENVHRLANAPKLDTAEPSCPTNTDEPLIPKKVDLANVEKNGHDASPIPPDWLKL